MDIDIQAVFYPPNTCTFDSEKLDVRLVDKFLAHNCS